MAQSARIAEMDLLRGFAILAVIAIHVSINFNVIAGLNGLVLLLTPVDVFSHFAVPLFIFISGSVLSLKYYEGFSIWRFYRKRAVSVIPQYLAFSALYLAGRSVLSGSLSINQAAFGILTASSSYHLWFFAVIVELYLLYPALIGLYRRYESDRRAPTLVLYALVLQVGWGVAYSLLGTFSGLPAMLLERVFLSQIFYFILGIFVARGFGGIRAYVGRMGTWRTAALAALLTGAVSLAWFYDFLDDSPYGLYSVQTLFLNVLPRLLEPALYVAAFILCARAAVFLIDRRSVLAGAVRSLGKYSFGIYLIHIFFLTLLVQALNIVHIRATDWPFYPLLFAGTLGLSYAAIHLLSYLPHSMAIVGAHHDMKNGILKNAQARIFS